MPARSDLPGPVNPKMTWNVVTAAAANTISAATRTTPGLRHRNARCKRPRYRSIAIGADMLMTCIRSSIRSAIGLPSMTARRGISMVANATP